MELNKLPLRALLISILGFGLMIGGCAQINPGDEDQPDPGLMTAAPVPNPDDLEPPPFSLTLYDYPENADVPPDGYQFVNIGGDDPERATDCRWVYGLVYYYWGGGVFWEWRTGIDIGPYAIPYWSMWIAVTRPSYDQPWVQFEPHGLKFYYSQIARISWARCGLPPGIEPEDLTVWYYNEELGEYEYIGGTVYPEYQYIEYNVDHFSRYVVACQP